MKNSNKGFTLIELLVVIAIIGILSSVVLAALTTARSKGQAAAIQAQLSNMRAQAELYYSNNTAYSTDVMTSVGSWTVATGHTDSTTDAALVGNGTGALGTLLAGVLSSNSASAPKFWVTKTAWAVLATPTTGTTWCVDSTGKSAGTSTAVALTSSACPSL